MPSACRNSTHAKVIFFSASTSRPGTSRSFLHETPQSIGALLFAPTSPVWRGQPLVRRGPLVQFHPTHMRAVSPCERQVGGHPDWQETSGRKTGQRGRRNVMPINDIWSIHQVRRAVSGVSLLTIRWIRPDQVVASAESVAELVKMTAVLRLFNSQSESMPGPWGDDVSGVPASERTTIQSSRAVMQPIELHRGIRPRDTSPRQP